MILTKRAVAILFCLLLIYLGYRWADRQFRVSNVRVHLPIEKAAPISSQHLHELETLFATPYDYLDRGKQTYVFVRPDDTHVLKLFDARCLMSGSHPLLMPMDAEGCEKRLKQVLAGYGHAFRHIPEEAAIVYFQSGADPSYSLPMIVRDRFQFVHNLDLAEVPFVLQRKALPSREVIGALLENDKIEEAIKRFDSLIDMYIEGYRRGIIDDDRNVMYNTGFIGARPVRLDLGRLRFDESIKSPETYKKDLHRIFVLRVGSWLKRHYPEDYPQLEAAIKAKVEAH